MRVVDKMKAVTCRIVMFATSLTAMVDCESYLERRERLLTQERRNFTGGDLVLSQKETLVNVALLRMKNDELEAAYTNSAAFLPSQNFLLARQSIERSKVFDFIKRVPKACVLHIHLLGAVSVDYVIEHLTYQEDVYGGYVNGVFKLKVLETPGGGWKPLKEYREENSSFDVFLKEKLTLTSSSMTESKEDVWVAFKNTFTTLFDLVAHRPTFKKYVYRVLEELYLDNVFYAELRGAFMNLYETNGTVYDVRVFIDTFVEVVDEFKADHNGFVGVKFIFNLYRGVDGSTMKAALDQLSYFKRLYPDFIAGFDLVGSEDDGKNLVDFHEELHGATGDVKFFFHAGETNWYGRADLNLADAVLLNTSRIGHGYALAKHPLLLELARSRDIAVELCPISNQVLKLHYDPRNHPATVLLATGYPVVIGNDDPSVWQSTGLSYDWYVVLMAMTWEDHGLEVLKKLAMNSIKYSAMSEKEKIAALDQFLTAWDRFVDEFLRSQEVDQRKRVYVV
ncbi:adenosine deaminase 2-like [Cylas formicarius]|uniref:adenosine deaminase 2-like n=1 Tax=Cylas formicarius TaxID=197179 RepID=UPI002958C970|nr:adenosine deaminase 2-like [Cylas formicarius]XP_060535940.1 adenosine deaminase 2-like [Cylas formicarius]XP_060535941.1 adenosine deaminase 2-like [Cylas formicarius]